MGSQPHESLSDDRQVNEIAPISRFSDASEPSNVAVTETFTGSQYLACAAGCVGSINTDSTTSSDTHLLMTRVLYLSSPRFS